MRANDPGEIRREAFRAAAGAVDRFLDRVGDPVTDRVGDEGVAAWDRFRAELARVVDLNLEMVRDAFGLYGELLGRDAPTPGGKGEQLVFGPGVPGAEAAAVLWLHNFEDDLMLDLELVGSGLSSDQGAVIDDPDWSFTPPFVSVPSRCAVPVLVTVAVPDTAEVGIYGGTIGVGAREGRPVDVLVDVVAMNPVPHASW